MAVSKFRYLKLILNSLSFYFSAVSIIFFHSKCCDFFDPFLYSEIDEYGFKRSADFDYEYYERIMTVYYAVLTSRALRWEKFLRKHDILDGGNTLKRFIRKGVPSSMRPEVWLKSSSAFVHRQRQPDLYQKLLKCSYDKETADQIRVDLPRTFPENIYFDQYKTSLFNVLITYSLNNKDVGYCQGLNYIAGNASIISKLIFKLL